MSFFKQEYIRSQKHRKWIASLPCCVTGNTKNVEAAHIRHGQSGGMGLKPCDSLCIPLHFMAHATQHRVGENEYWGSEEKIEKAKRLAQDLYKITGNTMAAHKIIAIFRGFQ